MVALVAMDLFIYIISNIIYYISVYLRIRFKHTYYSLCHLLNTRFSCAKEGKQTMIRIALLNAANLGLPLFRVVIMFVFYGAG